MGDLSELTVRSNIRFPKPIAEEEVKGYFDHLAKNYIKLDYTVKTKGQMEKINSENFFKEEYCSEIYGTMTDVFPKSDFRLTGFNMTLENNTLDEVYSPKITGLSFSLAGRDNLNQYPSEVKLWDKVRTLTDNYFPKTQE
jgi:hypothetical protein